MAGLGDVDDDTSGSGSDEPPSHEDAGWETPDRRHVDALLDISDEDFLKDLEPFEYHCYPAREEAVKGWARVAPLSCILLPQKRCRKPRYKDNPALLSADPSSRNAERSVSIKKSMPLNQLTGSWSDAAVAFRQEDALKWRALVAMHKAMSELSIGDRVEEQRALRETSLHSRPTKLQKPSHRPNNTVVPIKNMPFLPSIERPHLNPQRGCGGQVCSKKPPEGETTEENCLVVDKKSLAKGTGVDTDPSTNSAGLNSSFQQDSHLFSGSTVSTHNRYPGPVSSKHGAVYRASFSMDKRPHPSGTPAAGPPARTRPRKPLCAVSQ